MHTVEALVKGYLERANRGESVISDVILDGFARDCRAALARQLGSSKRDFTLRLSNVGRPACQLQMEKAGVPADPQTYDFRMKMIIGDLVECALMAIMQAAGVDIAARSEKVSVQVAGQTIYGNTDISLNENGENVVWDVKSASPYAYDIKFANFNVLKDDDPFGYVGQGFTYGVGANRRFGGWMVVNKSTGEFKVIETPPKGDEYNSVAVEALTKVKETVKKVVNDAPFERCFTDEPETHRKKPTGNRRLCSTCSFCDYKTKCWPTLEYRASFASEAKNKPYVYYTHIDDTYKSSAMHAEENNE